MPNFSLTNDVIIKNIIFYNHKGVIIQPNNATERLKVFYDSTLNFDGYTYDEWNKMVMEHGTKPGFLKLMHDEDKGIHVDHLAYLRYFPIDSFYKVKGCVIMFIDLNEIIKKLQIQSLSEESSFMILDVNNNIISSYNYKDKYYNNYIDNIKTNNGTYIEEISDITNWRYVLHIPENILMNKTIFIRNVILLLVGLLMITLVIAIYNSYKNTRPIKEIMEILRTGKKQKGDEYNQIKGAISNIIKKNQILNNDLKSELKRQKNTFLTKLFYGEFTKLNEVNEYMEHIGLENVKSDEYLIVVAQIYTPPNLSNKELYQNSVEEHIILARMINELTKLKCYVQRMETNRIAILISCSNNDDNNRIQQDLENLTKKIIEGIKISITFAVGSRFNNIVYASFSYIDAISMLEYPISNNSNNILWYNSKKQLHNTYYFPIEIEAKLISLVKMGEYNETINLLNEIKLKNQSISNSNSKTLLLEIKGMLMKLNFNLFSSDDNNREKYSSMIEKAYKSESYEILLNKINDIIKKMCNYIVDRRNSGNIYLRDKMINYIQENYQRVDMSLILLAEEFALSEKYVSKFFKEQTQKTISSYIENLRMIKAVDLMMNTDMTISIISNEIGYYNLNTFYKAFKRHYQVSPGTYRNKSKLDKNVE